MVEGVGGCKGDDVGWRGLVEEEMGVEGLVRRGGVQRGGLLTSHTGEPGNAYNLAPTSECRTLCEADAECHGYIQSGTQSGVGGSGNCVKYKKTPEKVNYGNGLKQIVSVQSRAKLLSWAKNIWA